MATNFRWHKPDCKAPDIHIYQGLPFCQTCDTSPDLDMLLTIQQTSALGTDIPPDEPPGKMNLWWPPSVPYTKTQDASSSEISDEMHQDKGEPTETAVHQSTFSTKMADAIYECDLGPDAFRLACLEPTPTLDQNGPIIHVSLETYDLNNYPEYEAVSYTWGGENADSSRKHPVYFGPFWDVLFHTKNCSDLLRFCMPVRGIRLLWVDALCINQSSIQDRSTQVANMGRIYRGCQIVVVYLGPDIALDLPPKRYPRRFLLQDIEAANSSSSGQRQPILQQILARRYFTRIWVIQELVLPKQVVMRIGDVDYTVDLSTREFLHQVTPSTAAPWLQYGISGGVSQDSICELMARTVMTASQDPRDRLFGILGLVGQWADSKDLGFALRADYSISHHAVAIGFFSYCLTKMKMPHILLGSRGLLANDNLPSWVPDWSSKDLWNLILTRQLSDHDSNELQEVLSEGPVAGILSRPSRYCSAGVLDRDSPLSCGTERGWETRLQVNSQTGALTVRLTRLCQLPSNLAFLKNTKAGRMFAALHRYYGLALISHFALDEIIDPRLDYLFFLDTPSKTTKIFLILRKLENSSDWRLVAPCDCFFIDLNDPRRFKFFRPHDRRTRYRLFEDHAKDHFGWYGDAEEREREHEELEETEQQEEIRQQRENPKKEIVFLCKMWKLYCVNAVALLKQLATPIQNPSLQWLLPNLKHVDDLLLWVVRALTKGGRRHPFYPIPLPLGPERHVHWCWLKTEDIEFPVSRDKWDKMPPSIHDEFAEFASKVGLHIFTSSGLWKPYPADLCALPSGSNSRASINIARLFSWVGSLVMIPWEGLAVADTVCERERKSIADLLLDKEIQDGDYWISSNERFQRPSLRDELRIDGSACQVTIV